MAVLDPAHPGPELQYEVWDRGRLVGRTDWAWPRRRGLGEFDGKSKYGRLLKEGQEPADAVFEEKRREDLLREATMAWMIRLIWSDLDRPDTTAARLRHLLTQGG